MIMNINFAVYFGIITVLNCFGDDQCLGLKLVSESSFSTAVLILVDAACCHCIQQLLLLYLGALVCIVKLFQTDHEALRRGRSELLILLELCNIRPNTTQRRSVEKVIINDWQASVTLILLFFHRLDLAS